VPGNRAAGPAGQGASGPARSGFRPPGGAAEEEPAVGPSAATATPPAGLRGPASPAGPAAGHAKSRVAVIGDGVRVSGYALAGALVCPAANREEARAAWAALPPDIAVVILTADAAAWLAGLAGPAAATAAGGRAGLPRRRDVLPVVLPP